VYISESQRLKKAMWGQKPDIASSATQLMTKGQAPALINACAAAIRTEGNRAVTP
jgi:hypothetical protein